MLRIAIVLLAATSGSAWAMCARAIAAHSFFRASTHAAENILVDPEFGPRYEELIALAQWVQSGPGRMANTLTATWIDTAARDTADRALALLEEAAYAAAGMAITIVATPPEPHQFFLGSHPAAALYVASQSTGAADFPRQDQVTQLIGTLPPRPIHLVTNERLAVVHRIASGSRLRDERSSRAYAAAYGSGKSAKNFEKEVERAIEQSLTGRSKPNQSLLFRFFHECGATRIWESLGHHRRLATTFHAALEQIYDQCVGNVRTTPERRQRLKQMLRTYCSHYYEGFFPPRYEPFTGEDLQTHELNQLHTMAVQLMGEFHAARERRRKRQLEQEAEERARQKDPPKEQSQVDAAGRLARHLAREEERRREQQAAEEAATATIVQTPGGGPPPEPVPLLAESDLPALVRRRAISSVRAEQIIAFYDNLQPSEKTLFLFVLGELFLDPSRRLSAVLHGDVWHLRDRELMEVRIQGNTMPIRLYFGIKKGHGVYLTGAHYKRGGDAEQMVIVDNDDVAWRKFLKP